MIQKRTALVTGAAGGIGRSIAEKLVELDHDVLAVDLEPDPDGPGVPFEADLLQPGDNRAAVKAAIEVFGSLDLVIPCAGFQHVAPIDEFDEDRWDALIGVMLTSPFLLAKYAWPYLRASGRGQIIVIASVHAIVASPFKAGYIAAKHGVLGLTKVLALEGAEHGIRVAAICPGYVRTPLVEAQIPAQALAHGLGEEEVLTDVILGPHAVKELIQPGDVAEVVAFLMTDAGRTITGSPVVMDMGWSAR
jgi:3-hydroxybutyrate dehydrogenase